MSQLDRRGFLELAAGAAGVHMIASGADGSTENKQPESLSFSRDLPIHEPYDVVVCGGGPAGTAAALAARRTGLKVLLVESQGQLGGMGTSGLVSHWLGGRTGHDCSRWVVGGIFRSMAEEATQRGFALLPKVEKIQPHGWGAGLAHGIPFDPYVMAKAVIDATGDADVAARSGCRVVKGRKSDGLMMPVTLQFHVNNVDQDTLATYIYDHKAGRLAREIRKLREQGEWTFPYDIFISVQLNEKGTMMINTTRICGIDGTDGASKTQGMIRGRAEIQKLMAPCFAMGEAAGQAARQVAENNLAFDQIDVSALRDELRRNAAVVDW